MLMPDYSTPVSIKNELSRGVVELFASILEHQWYVNEKGGMRIHPPYAYRRSATNVSKS
jgi:hypothetical protein